VHVPYSAALAVSSALLVVCMPNLNSGAAPTPAVVGDAVTPNLKVGFDAVGAAGAGNEGNLKPCPVP
jgi:hypothetical protein